jgi:hypothetical protein
LNHKTMEYLFLNLFTNKVTITSPKSSTYDKK